MGTYKIKYGLSSDEAPFDEFYSNIGFIKDDFKLYKNIVHEKIGIDAS